jgi:hypothetical protein
MNLGLMKVGGDGLAGLIRYRYNTKADQTPNGEWKWRVVLETDNGLEEVLVKSLVVNVASFRARGRP